jgi:hypothetical protein
LFVTPSRARKTAHATEQDRADIVEQRQAWFDGRFDLDPDKLVFIDETWASTNMARQHGRCQRGERLTVVMPYGHWKTTTFVAGLRVGGLSAAFVLDMPINRIAFETYVEKVLVPSPRPGDIVIMDNLSSHKGPRVAANPFRDVDRPVRVYLLRRVERAERKPEVIAGLQRAADARKLREMDTGAVDLALQKANALVSAVLSRVGPLMQQAAQQAQNSLGKEMQRNYADYGAKL